MYSIRTYQPSDFDQVLDLLNNNKEFDQFTPELLHEKLYDDPDWNNQLALVVESDKIIIGFMQGVIRLIRGEKLGYIKLMVVESKFQRQGVASQMYNAIEEKLIADDVKKIRIYDSPLNYFMPGIDPRYTAAVCFALKNGFKHIGDAINMKVDLNYSHWKTDEQIDEFKKQGIEILRAGAKDREQLFELISEEWALWRNELEMAYKSNPAALFVAKLKGKVKAFAAYNGNNIGTGWFGPMGTHPDLRGKGVGSLLLYLCLADMKKMGLKESTIPWVAPIAFYSHYAGAKINRVFWRFEKEL